MPEITKSRAKLQAYAESRERDRRAFELIAQGVEPETAWKQAFDEQRHWLIPLETITRGEFERRYPDKA